MFSRRGGAPARGAGRARHPAAANTALAPGALAAMAVRASLHLARRYDGKRIFKEEFMIKHTREKQVKIVATGLALRMLAAPLPALPLQESSVLMASGGVVCPGDGAYTGEYIQIAQDAQGASWGYTNIGVANVESGNLNVRAVSLHRRYRCALLMRPVKWSRP